ncbi:hypothetical protein AAFF_G00388140 [Aldrovandia affinis]|uniref:Uncharacterized protein n=1 Tax=Aldrovandia affinis TaxID=143900 RepID=A0AAD7WLF9_9TELE|nr:hypothetical protein AAFF_G00388140 [Aldrovandia affinis]
MSYLYPGLGLFTQAIAVCCGRPSRRAGHAADEQDRERAPSICAVTPAVFPQACYPLMRSRWGSPLSMGNATPRAPLSRPSRNGCRRAAPGASAVATPRQEAQGRRNCENPRAGPSPTRRPSPLLREPAVQKGPMGEPAPC